MVFGREPAHARFRTGAKLVTTLVAMLVVVLTAATAAPSAGAAADGGEHAKRGKERTLRVCEHGCRFRAINRAVKAVENARRTTIKVRPGTYEEGVRLFGKKYNGLTITGTGSTPGKVVLEGDRDGDGEGDIQNAVDAVNVSNLRLLNMRAQNYATNGFFIHADPGRTCNGYLMKKLEAAFNRSYGLFARNCVGGRITRSKGWGHGDSAFYIGETPAQPPRKRQWTQIDHVRAHTNVLGYSGTNSKYVDIHDSYFFNNGAGIVPNTLDSERFEPSATGRIRNNKVFWNNFNYYKPDSPVETVSGGLGELPPDLGGGTINYPTGAGVVLLGSDGWTVTGNQIFGNAKWGVALLSDPFNEGDDALNQNNRVTGNEIGRDGTDTNGTDFWSDGSGSGNCFEGNDPGSGTLTYGDAGAATPLEEFYPECPAPADSGTGGSFGDLDQLLMDLIPYVTSDPPCAMEESWATHPHPDFEGLEPLVVAGECA